MLEDWLFLLIAFYMYIDTAVCFEYFVYVDMYFTSHASFEYCLQVFVMQSEPTLSYCSSESSFIIGIVRIVQTNPPLLTDLQVIIPHCLHNLVLLFIYFLWRSKGRACLITRVIMNYIITPCLRFIIIWIVWVDEIVHCSQCHRNLCLNLQAIFWCQQ